MERFLKKFFLFLLLVYSFNKVEASHNGSSSINYFAQLGTLGIETPGSNGSGFIIGKKKNKYYFLTAGHVAFSDPKKEEYWVYSVADKESKRYKVTSFIKPKEFEGKDIVIGSFKTVDNLNIIPIFPLGEFILFEKSLPNKQYYTFEKWAEINGVPLDSENLIMGDPVIAGISTPTKAITIPLFRTSIGVMQSRAIGNQNGYELIYSTTSTVPGMSGGGLFGARKCPKIIKENQEDTNSEYLDSFILKYTKEHPYHGGSCIGGCGNFYAGVIGMHGMSEEYANSGSRSGSGLAIPLSLFTEFFKKNSSEYGIPTGKNYYQLIRSYCE